MIDLENIAMLYRSMQLFAHMAHNFTTGTSFFGDHKFFKHTYEAYDEAYDGLIERVIGLGGKPNIGEINFFAAKIAKDVKDNNTEAFFKRLLVGEEEIRKMIDSAVKGKSQGTVNFLQGLADQSEQRTYKIKQRVAK